MKSAVRRMERRSFFALNRRISQQEKEKKMNLTEAPHLRETDPSIWDVHDIGPRQAIRKGPSHAPGLSSQNRRKSQETHTALSEFESYKHTMRKVLLFFTMWHKGKQEVKFWSATSHAQPLTIAAGKRQAPHHIKGMKRRMKAWTLSWPNLKQRKVC